MKHGMDTEETTVTLVGVTEGYELGGTASPREE